MNRKNRVCSAALSAVLTLTLVTAPAQALGTAGAERTEGDYAVMQAVSGPSIGEIDSSGIIYNGKHRRRRQNHSGRHGTGCWY